MGVSFEVLLRSYSTKVLEELVSVWGVGRRVEARTVEKVGDLGDRRKCFAEPDCLRLLHVSCRSWLTFQVADL